MNAPQHAVRRRAILIVALALAWLCGIPYAAAQVVNLPPAAKSDAEKSDAQKANTPRPDPVREAINKFRSLSLVDLIDWARLHGLSLVLVVLMAFVILSVANRLHPRLVSLLSGHTARGTAAEQENRARTLVGVLHNALRTTVIALALIMILELIGIPIGPLMGGVAVVGLAVAFGAQSLIKDYFTGFLVLLEQQYMIGDVIKIGVITGRVEQITLRLTVLRDLEGAVHFIPHGQINLVTNLTHGWSQAVFDLSVPCEEAVERIHELFFELAAALRKDAAFGPMIVSDAELLGVESLGDATYSLKFAVRTLPQDRWKVKRELLRRIKERFQEEKIKVNVPA